MIPENLKKICDEYLQARWPDDVFEYGEAYRKIGRESFAHCHETLLGMGGEFDEDVARVIALETIPWGISMLRDDDPGNIALRFALRCMRWQFKEDQAQLAAKDLKIKELEKYVRRLEDEKIDTAMRND